jgi:hypothetical protein
MDCRLTLFYIILSEKKTQKKASYMGIHERTYGQTYGWTYGRTYGWTYGHMY